MPENAYPEQGALSMEEAGNAIGDVLGDELDDELEPEDGAVTDDTPEESDEESTEESTEETEGAEEAEPVSLDSLDTVAEQLGVSVDDLMNIPVTMRAAGEDVTITLAEQRQGYARGADYARQTQELAQAREAHQVEYEQKSKELRQQYELVGQLSGHLRNLVAGELNTPQMQAMKLEDAGKWAAAVQEINTRIQGIDQVQNHLAATMHQTQQALDAENQERTKQLLAKESEALLSKVADWSDQKDSDLRSGLSQYYGFTNEELIGGVHDHRMILVALDALAYRQAQATEQKVVKKSPKVPKVTKPGKSSGGGQGRKKAKAEAAHRKSKTVESAAAAINERIKEL